MYACHPLGKLAPWASEALLTGCPVLSLCQCLAPHRGEGKLTCVEGQALRGLES